MTTDLDRLIEAVEAGEQADGRRDFSVLPRGDDVGCNRTFAYRAFHGSLDAAVLLVQSLLPGWWAEIHICGRLHHAEVEDILCGYTYYGHNMPSPARALLLATLRAYRSTREDG